MATTPPTTPEPGDDILPWARALTDFVRQLVSRESVDIAPEITSTGTRYRLRRRPGSPLWTPVPFLVAPATNPDPTDPDTKGYVQVLANGTILAKYDDPTSNISVTGLSTLDNPAPFQFDFSDTAEHYVWIRVDLTPLYLSTPGPPTGKVDYGEDWNEGGDDDDDSPDADFWPSPVEFDTDDGTPGGSDDDPPDNRKQKAVYWPLARTYDITDNPLPGIDIPGYMLTDTIRLVQMSHFNLTLYDDCSAGASVKLIRPHHGCLPG